MAEPSGPSPLEPGATMAEVGERALLRHLRSRIPLGPDVTLLGQGDRLLRREGAKPGDLVVVTGTLGAAAAGLRFLLGGTRMGAEGEVADRGEWSGATADALLACLRAQLDPGPPL